MKLLFADDLLFHTHLHPKKRLLMEVHFEDYIEIQRDIKLPSLSLEEFQTLPLACRKMEALKLLEDILSMKENIKLKKSEKDQQLGLTQHKLLRMVKRGKRFIAPSGLKKFLTWRCSAVQNNLIKI